MKAFFEKINWKDGFLYFVFVQLEVIILSSFGIGIVNIVIGLFIDTGLIKDLVLIIVLFLIEVLIKFFIFLSVFKNNKQLTFKQFSLNYLFTFVLRALISIIFRFSPYTSGITVSLSGIFMANIFINTNIYMPQQVPIIYYLLIFAFIEATTVFIAFMASRLNYYLKSKLKKELHNE